MAEIVELHRKPELGYWRCDCGCNTYRLRNDGEIECAYCEELTNSAGEWRLPKSETAPTKAPEQSINIRVVDFNAPNVALKRVLGKIDIEATCAVVVIDLDGSFSVWGAPSDFSTRARRGWLRRRLEEVRRILIGESIGKVE
jgi:hypothetical protein